MNSEFINKIESLGYFKGLAEDKARTLKQEFEKSGWLAIFCESHRFFMADSEDLAEGGIGQLVEEVAPFLKAQGVTVPEVEDDITEDGYVVKVGGVAHPIYDSTEMTRDSSDKELGLMWGLSTVRGFRILDELLAKAGSAERAYGINGGNDLFLIFLTPELHQAIMEHPEAIPYDGPYILKEEYPWFGQPEKQKPQTESSLPISKKTNVFPPLLCITGGALTLKGLFDYVAHSFPYLEPTPALLEAQRKHLLFGEIAICAGFFLIACGVAWIIFRRIPSSLSKKSSPKK